MKEGFYFFNSTSTFNPTSGNCQASILPSCASTSCLTIGTPNPVPPETRALAAGLARTVVTATHSPPLNRSLAGTVQLIAVYDVLLTVGIILRRGDVTGSEQLLTREFAGSVARQRFHKAKLCEGIEPTSPKINCR